jgi:hypothetical protein
MPECGRNAVALAAAVCCGGNAVNTLNRLACLAIGLICIAPAPVDRAAGAESDAVALVDYGRPIEQHSMSGFLFGIDPASPPPSQWTSALAPGIWRGTKGAVAHASSLGASYELAVSFAWNPPGVHRHLITCRVSARPGPTGQHTSSA